MPMSLRRIDLNLLVVFEAIVAEASVSRAARRLHLSQPALSHALGRLREAFGDPILVRQGRAMEATPVALAALPEVRAILAQVGRLLSHGGRFDPATSERSVHIGASDHAAVTVLARVLPRIRLEAPSLRLRVLHAGRSDAPALLRSGQLDLALGVFNTLTADLQSVPLLEEHYLCAVARGRGIRPPATVVSYLAAEHLNVLVQGDALGLIDEALAVRGQARRIVLTVPHFAAAPALLAGSNMVYTGPESLLRRTGVASTLRIAAAPIELPPFRTQLAWSQRTEQDEGLRWLRDCITQAMEKG